MQQQLDYVLRTVEERGVRFVRLWFTDVLGSLKSFAITPAELETALEEGMTFDGSAIEGYSRVQESDMLAVPDANTFEIVPWRGDDAPVARMFCDIQHLSGEPFEGDPRYVLKRNLERAREKGFTFYAAPEMEFFVFASADAPEPLDHAGFFDLTQLDMVSELAPSDHRHARGDGHPRRVQLPRARPEPARDRPPLHRRAHDGRQRHDVPAGREGGRHRPRRVRHVHAQAHRGRVRLGDAHPPLAVRGRRQRVPRPGRRVRPLEGRQVLHRRAAPPRPRDHRGHEPDGQLLQAADRRVRGTGARVLGPQQRVGARAGAAAQEGQGELDPHRVPLARPGVQPVPRVLGDARGRAQGRRGGLRAPARGHQQHLRDDARGAARRGHRLAAADARRGDRGDGRLGARGRGAGRARLRVLHPQQAAEWTDYKSHVTPWEIDRYLGSL